MRKGTVKGRHTSRKSRTEHCLVVVDRSITTIILIKNDSYKSPIMKNQYH